MAKTKKPVVSIVTLKFVDLDTELPLTRKEIKQTIKAGIENETPDVLVKSIRVEREGNNR